MKNILTILLLALVATLALASPEAMADPEPASTNWRGNKGNSDVGAPPTSEMSLF